MNFIVIEGDNGTGKDTLAQGLEPYGFNILSYNPKALDALRAARQAAANNQTQAFLRYNQTCSDLAEAEDTPLTTNILIRYWTSTLASAFADKGWSLRKVDSLLDRTLPSMARPVCAIRLTCSMEERVRRIKARNASGFDDITLARAKRYEAIFSHIMERTPYDWITIPTEGASRQDIVATVLEALTDRMPDRKGTFLRPMKTSA